MKHKNFALALALGLVGFATLGGNAAMAANTKVYPGNMCHPEYGEDESTFARLSNGLWRSYTIDKKYLRVICPIVKNNASSTAPIKAYVRLYGRDNGNIYCQIRSYDWRGSTYRQGTAVTIPGGGFQAVDVFGPTTYSGGTLQLKCDLPKSAEIRNYAVFE